MFVIMVMRMTVTHTHIARLYMSAGEHHTPNYT